MICAKTHYAQLHLQKQFSKRNVKKTYLAIVSKRPKHDAAIIQWPIQRSPKKPSTFRVNSEGKAAETYYELKKELNEGLFLLEVKPKTGRTHQIRVHLSELGCPIVGDTVYGGKSWPHLRLLAAELEVTLPNSTRATFRSNQEA